MNINSSLINELKQKEYRDAYAAAQIRIVLPFHIRALRMQRGWSQMELARRAGMAQPRIAEIEKPGARRLNIETLLRIAIAFDVGLQVRFMPFSELVEWAESFSPDASSITSFDNEIAALARNTAEVQGILLTNRPIDVPALLFKSQLPYQLPTYGTTTTNVALNMPRTQTEPISTISVSSSITTSAGKETIVWTPIGQGSIPMMNRNSLETIH